MSKSTYSIPLALQGRTILLIISGGIAAYKSLDLIRRLRDQGAEVPCILTDGGAKFITPLSVSALSGQTVYGDLWSLTDERDMGHIRLARDPDLIVIAPATADLLAQMAHGLARDLATTTLLATTRPVLAVPAMNPAMWSHPATQANIALLRQRGVGFIGPAAGLMACGETGEGRMAEVADITAAVVTHVVGSRPLAGLSALVTSGPTMEPIDPARFITNRSSGKQGHAIAAALAAAGAAVRLVTGPVQLAPPVGVEVVAVETAAEMLAACQAALPTDIAICSAAVADWRVKTPSPQKIKKQQGVPQSLELVENPDILATLSRLSTNRPRLVIGFAAETEQLEANATAKYQRKGCDWLLANDVSGDVFGGDQNRILFLDKTGAPDLWPEMSKADVAARLVAKIITAFDRT
jgi:phosphopantothenoylcysteine decarboxylase / phosphopantothenate---cysteine ligase